MKELPKWFEKIEYLGRVKEYLEKSYTDTTAFRTKAVTIKKANDNGFNMGPIDMEKDPDIYRSSMILEGVDIFKGGMNFPDWHTKAILTNGPKARELESMAVSALEWMIRETGFEEAWDDSKIPTILYGDGYRKPFKIHLGDGKYFPQYEEVDGKNLYLDTDAVDIWSKNSAKSSSFFGYGMILAESQLRQKLGLNADAIMKHVKAGAVVDIDQLGKKQGKTETSRDNSYYEYIEIQDAAEGVEIIVVGGNWFPILINGDIVKKIEFPKAIQKLNLPYENEYKHKDEFGRNTLTLHNSPFYYDRDNVRNRGLGERLYRFQKVDELLENLSLNATQLKALQIPYIVGGKANSSSDKMSEWVEKRKSNKFEMLDIPAGTPGTKPEIGVLKFDGISAEEMRVSKDDHKSSARNSIGISFNRLEVRQNEGLGQTKLIEAEKIKTVEDIVKQWRGKLEHELKGLLLYLVNNKGFGLKDVMIEYTQIIPDVKSPIDGEGLGEMENPHKAISLVDAAKALKKFAFRVYVDMDTMVTRNNLSLMEDYVKMAGLIDGQAMPEAKKALLEHIYDIGKIPYDKTTFAGVQQESPQGGVSQFQQAEQSPLDMANSSQPVIPQS